ncbi:MAG TPA: hypothetical protein VMG10_14750 [Gemmataceae bacterium]|nr:hypothetical protein [Gemmataceae bacterium]
MSPSVCRFDKRLTLACMLAFLLAGCGGSGKGEVAGKVTYQGKPLVFGSVQFIGSDGQPHVSAINTEGNYSLKDVLVGDNHVLVLSLDPRKVVRHDRQGKPVEEPTIDPKLWFPIPEKYSDLKQSDLTFTVEGGKKNTYDIALK